MSHIISWDGETTRLRTYDATTKARGPSTIRIVLETSDAFELGYILRTLDQATKEQDAAKKQLPSRKGKAKPTDKPALAAPALMLTFRGDE